MKPIQIVQSKFLPFWCKEQTKCLKDNYKTKLGEGEGYLFRDLSKFYKPDAFTLMLQIIKGFLTNLQYYIYIYDKQQCTDIGPINSLTLNLNSVSSRSKILALGV